MRVLITGDTHGNGEWLRDYLFPVAVTMEADAIVVLGDFGAWEHTDAGRAFFDHVSVLTQKSSIPLYWLHGNHDKHSHTLASYAPGDHGFLTCRENLYYIPQGHSWTWGGVDLRSFGGAYSVDKQWRVEREHIRGEKETLWFPEEEMTDADMDTLLAADSGPKHIVLSHDRPYSSNPNWNRKNFVECVPNQLRLDKAMVAHNPMYWLHGHLHYYYEDKVGSTTVIGLEPDDKAADVNWNRNHTWVLAILNDGTPSIRRAGEVRFDRKRYKEAKTMMA